MTHRPNRKQTALARSNFSRIRALHSVPLKRSSLALAAFPFVCLLRGADYVGTQR